MGNKLLFFVCAALVAISAIKADNPQQDGEAGDPHLQGLAEFAAATLVTNDFVDPSIDGGAWMLQTILDAQYVPPNPPSQPAIYFLTLELSLECNNETSHVPACEEENSSYVRLCEVAIADEPWAKRRSLVPGKIACATRERSNELSFVGTTIANSMPLDDPALDGLTKEALKQMASKTNSQHSLVSVLSARKVVDAESVTYYLTLNTTTKNADQDAYEVCDVSLEESLEDSAAESRPVLRSLRCFSTGDEDEAESLGLQKFPQENLSDPQVRTAVLAAFGQIDGEFQSNFRLKLVGSKVLRTVVSLDSGSRESRLQLGLGSSFCIKRPDLEAEEEQDEAKTCNLDPERDPFICDVTAIQWPWVPDAFLFSDLACQPSNAAAIAEQLEPLPEADDTTEEIDEVQGNGADDEPLSGKTGPCTGCPQEANVKDPKIQKIAQVALTFLDGSTNDDAKHGLVEIKKATAQVVAGIKYELEMEVAQTNCKKGEENDKCTPNLATRKVCTVEILEQSWRNSTEVKDISCLETSVPPVRVANKNPRGVEVGGAQIVSNDDPAIQELAQFALDSMDAVDDSSAKRVLVRVHEVTKQLVAGYLYRLKIQFALAANCAEQTNAKDCKPSQDSPLFNCEVVIHEQPWLDSKKVTEATCTPVAANKARKFPVSEPVFLPGGFRDADTESEEIQNHAKIAVKQFNAQSNAPSTGKLVKVLSAKTQVVAGTNIDLQIEVGFTKCPKNGDDAQASCDLDESQNHEICDVRIFKNLQGKAAVTSLNCKTLMVDELEMSASSDSEQIVASVVAAVQPNVSGDNEEESPVLGGINKASVETPDMKEYAAFAASRLQEQLNFGYTLQVVELLSATTQVVAGKSITIKMVMGQTNCEIGSEAVTNGLCQVDESKPRITCTVKIWDRPWLNAREVTSSSCDPVSIPPVTFADESVDSAPLNEEVVQSKSEPERTPIVGGIEEANSESNEIKEYVDFVLPHIEAGSNFGYTLKLIEIVSSKVQVVQGRSITVTVVLGQTNCEIGSQQAANGPCEVDPSKPRQTCTANIWDRPWLNSREVTSMSCESVGIPLVRDPEEELVAREDARPLAGAPEPVDVENEEIQAMLPTAINAINQESNDPNALKVNRVLLAFRKVVSGMLYRLKLEVGVTTCAKGENVENCELDPSESLRYCDLEIWDQPWLQKREVQNLECKPAPKLAHQYGRDGRADAVAAELVVSSQPLLGGARPISVDDAKVKEIALFATTTIAERQNQAGNLELVKIREAKRQVVAGNKYYLTLELSSANAELDGQVCQVVVFDQPWSQTRELSDVSCSIEKNGPALVAPSIARVGGGRQLAGGVSPADISDPKIQEIADFATSSIAAQQNEDGNLELVQITEAKTQVVAGVNYYLTLQLRSVKAQEDKQVCEVVVFDQPWTETRRITSVQCSKQRTGPPRSRKSKRLGASARQTGIGGRPLAGGISPTDLNDPKLREIAEFATTTIAEQQNQSGNLQLIRIKEARKQVVAGTKYYLTLELGLVDSQEGNQVCEVAVFDQPWTNTRKISDVKCSQAVNGPMTGTANSSPVPASTGTESLPLLGGISPADTNDQKLQEIAQFATTTIAQQQNQAGKLQLIRIKQARTQVVAGTNYYLTLELGVVGTEENNQECELVVFDQPWTGTREVSDVKCSQAVNGPVTGRARRPAVSPTTGSRPLAGGISPANTADAKLQEIAQFATTAIAARQNQAGQLQLIRIKEARTQVVAGINYFLTLELGSVNNDQAKQVCEVVVFDQSWTQTRELSDVKCSAARSGRRTAKAVQLIRATRRSAGTNEPLLGAASPADASDLRVQEIAQFATNSIAQQQNQVGNLQLIRVKEARTQIVSGKKYYLTLELSSIDRQQGNQECKVAVWDQPWTQTRKITDLQCTAGRSGARVGKSVRLGAAPSTRTAPRTLLGDVSDADPSEPRFQEIAQFATTTIAAQQNQEEKLRLIKIKEARTQVVAGTNFYLTIELGSSDNAQDNQECEVVVFDQPWTQTRELSSVKCSAIQAASRTSRTARRGTGSTAVSVPSVQLGGLSSVDPSEPILKEVAQFAVSTIAARQNEAENLQLVEIKEAKQQIVSGVQYYLTLQLSHKSADQNSQTCQVVVFDQPWTQTRKLLDAQCSKSSSRRKRAIETLRSGESAPPTGSLKSIALDDPKVVEMANFALPIINQRSNSANPLQLVKTHSAHTRVVSGVKYYLVLEVKPGDCTLSSASNCKPETRKAQGRYCKVVVWEQAWQNKKEVTDLECTSTKPKVKNNNKNKGKKGRAHKGNIRTGAPSPVGVASPEIQEYAGFALNQINAESNDQSHIVLSKIMESTTQVVSGKKIGLTLEVGYSNCAKGAANGDCLLDATRPKQICRVSIWDRPWLNDRRVTNLACEEPVAKNPGKAKKASRKARQVLLGGFSPADANDPTVKVMADFALSSLQSNGREGIKLVEVKSVEKQIVSGVNYRMKLVISPVSCNGPCAVEVCDVTVYDQPWTNTRKVSSVSCSPARRKRETSEDEVPDRLFYMEAFRGFLAKFKKVYATWEEFEYRYHVYRENQGKIKELQDHEQGTAHYGDTEFADLTEDEFRELYTGFRPDLRGNHILHQAMIPNVTLPDEFDWRAFNVVTPVKNQGMCGSCWAYSVTGNVEGLYAIKHKQLYSLSEQELVDCDKLDNGCNGGLPENAYKAIEELGGLETEDDYPYEGKNGKCRLEPKKVAVQVKGAVEISKNETEMAQWLVANGPISIGINANAMQFYAGGISHPWKYLCNPGGIDHGVLIVGYGVREYPLFNKTMPYWIVKNSWGTRWGEQGYYRIYRGDGTCGVNLMATSAVVD